MLIYIDKTLIEYNDKKAYPTFRQMEETGDYSFVYGLGDSRDMALLDANLAATNSIEHAEAIAEMYPELTVYVIQMPLNKQYESTRPNIRVAWCWNDFQFLVYFPKRDWNGSKENIQLPS